MFDMLLFAISFKLDRYFCQKVFSVTFVSLVLLTSPSCYQLYFEKLQEIQQLPEYPNYMA